MPNTGYIAIDPHQSVSAKSPTHTGKCTVDGKQYVITGWTTKRGNQEFIKIVLDPDRNNEQHSRT